MIVQGNQDLFSQARNAMEANPFGALRLVGIDEEQIALLQKNRGIRCPVPGCTSETDAFHPAKSFPQDGAVRCRKCDQVYDQIDLLVACGMAESKTEAAELILKHAGASLTPRKANNSKSSPMKEKLFRGWRPDKEADQVAVMDWCSRHKPGISVEAVFRCGGTTGDYMGNPALGIPMFDSDIRTITGWAVYHLDGSLIDGKKITNVSGSKSGIVGSMETLRRLPSISDTERTYSPKTNATTPTRRNLFDLEESHEIKRVFRVEGVSDSLALETLVFQSDEKTTAVFANGCGASENPDKLPFRELVERIAASGAEFILIGDNDDAGQAGAAKWTQFARKKGCKVSTCSLPDALNGKEVNDVRDFCLFGGNLCDIKPEAVRLSPSNQPNRREEKISIAKEASILFLPLSAFERREVEYLWENKLLLGKVNLLAGDGGIRKSFLTTGLASHVSTGKTWPDGSPCQKGSVIIVNCEDDVSDTIRPRCEDQGADLDKIFTIKGVKSESRKRDLQYESFCVGHVAQLREMIDMIGDVRLVVFDPITALMGGHDDFKAVEVRSSLMPIVELAQERHFCMLLVTHFRKPAAQGISGKAVDRIVGSGAYTQIARQVWVCYESIEEEGTVFVLHGKGNLIRKPRGFSFRIDKKDCVQFLDLDIKKKADDYEAELRKFYHTPRQATERLHAEKWLAERLGAGPVLSEVLHDDAQSSDISEKTLRRAMKNIGVINKKAKGGKFFCFLPNSGMNESDFLSGNPNLLEK